MTLDDKTRREIIIYRLRQADGAISDVELLISNNRFHAAVDRIYYGMFYSLLALALENRFESSKHAQLIGWFNKNFIRTGKMDNALGKILTMAFNRRTKSDYDTYVEFKEENVIEMFVEMKRFISEIKHFLSV